MSNVLESLLNQVMNVMIASIPLVIALLNLKQLKNEIKLLREDNKSEHDKIWQTLNKTMESSEFNKTVSKRLQDYIAFINDPAVCDFLIHKTHEVVDLVNEIINNLDLYKDHDYLENVIESAAAKVKREGYLTVKAYQKDKKTIVDKSFIDRFYEGHENLVKIWKEDLYSILTDSFNSKNERIKDITITFITKYARLAHELLFQTQTSQQERRNN